MCGKYYKRDIEERPPEDFFNLFGAIKDDTFIEPDKMNPKYDLPVEQI
jgi:hypothetical protein